MNESSSSLTTLQLWYLEFEEHHYTSSYVFMTSCLETRTDLSLLLYHE